MPRGRLPQDKKRARLLRAGGVALTVNYEGGEHRNGQKYIKRRHMVSLAGTTLVLTGKESRSHAAISPGKLHCVRPGFLRGLCSCRRTTGGFLDSIYVTIHRASKMPLKMGRTSCTATEMCPQSKNCMKKSSAGREEVKVCMKGLHGFKLAPKHSFASPKLPPQLSF